MSSVIEVLGDVNWLVNHGFIPLQSTILARELRLGNLVRTDDVANALLKLL